MRFILFLSLLVISISIHAQEASPNWPQIGSAFPKGDKIPKKTISVAGHFAHSMYSATLSIEWYVSIR